MSQTAFAYSKQNKDVNASRLLRSSAKVLKLLEFVGSRTTSVGLSEITKEFGGNRGTVYQQLQTLIQTGWIRQNPDGKYLLALKIVHFAKNSLDQSDIVTRMGPLLEQLAQVSGEAPAIAMLDIEDVLIIKRVESRQLIRADIRVGTRMPIMESAAGQILVAYASEERIENLKSRGIKIPSKNQITEIKEKGFVIQVDSWQKGLSAAAVPLTIGLEKEILSLSMACPTSRFDEKKTIAHLKLTLEQFKKAG
jgi:IclR family acetate operon transcriptional repressor